MIDNGAGKLVQNFKVFEGGETSSIFGREGYIHNDIEEDAEEMCRTSKTMSTSIL